MGTTKTATDYSRVYLIVGIPCVDYIHAGFVKCLTNLVRHLDEIGINFEVWFKSGALIYCSRDEIVRDAAAQRFTHILWLDADMAFNPDIFEKLYATQEAEHAPLVTALYNSRHRENKPVMWSSLNPGGKDIRMEKYPDEKTFPIEGCGFGCCLTRVDMMEDIWAHEGTCFLPTHQYGEDLAFCERAMRVRGYKMIADSGVCCGHIGQKLVWPDERSEQLVL